MPVEWVSVSVCAHAGAPDRTRSRAHVRIPPYVDRVGRRHDQRVVVSYGDRRIEPWNEAP